MEETKLYLRYRIRSNLELLQISLKKTVHNKKLFGRNRPNLLLELLYAGFKQDLIYFGPFVQILKKVQHKNNLYDKKLILITTFLKVLIQENNF